MTYLAFIALGLPDGMLGAAWPSMRVTLQVPVFYAGILSTLISFCTVFSSLMCDRLIRRLGTGRLTALSVALTAGALWGFSASDSYGLLLLWAIPYGLGAGCVDAALNNYAAIHFASRHMSWLHCMWGLGALTGPLIMARALAGPRGWSGGYLAVALMQGALAAVLVLSLRAWKPHEGEKTTAKKSGRSLSVRDTLRIPGAREAFGAFLGYCALEHTASLWASSYLIARSGFTPAEAAGLASLFFIGITVGRALSGFATLKWDDSQMVRLGFGVMGVGIALMLLPLGRPGAIGGLVLLGLGCAPVYPCIMHATPQRFGQERSQSVIGLQMAFAYLGNCTIPPLFGVIANSISAALLPLYLLLLWGGMAWLHERLIYKTQGKGEKR